MESRVKMIESKLDSIQSNMPSKSDVAAVSAKSDAYMVRIDNLIKVVGDLAIQVAKREEADKHRDKEYERITKEVDVLKTTQQAHSQYIAADKPFKEIRTWSIRIIIGAVIGAVMISIGLINK